MKKKQLMRMHLQYFTEGGEGGTPGAKETPAVNLDELSEEELASIKEKFGFKTDDDVNKLIDSKYASWAQKLEYEKNEAARLAQLSEEERQQALIQREKDEFEAEKAKFRQEQLFVEKGKQLVVEDMPAEFADRVIGDSAEEILADVKKFRAKWDEALEVKVNERLKRSAANQPDFGGGGSIQRNEAGALGKRLASQNKPKTTESKFF